MSEKNAAESKTAAQEAAERATQAGIAASNAAEEAERSAGIATDAAGSSALNAENAQKSALAAQQSAKNAAESQSVAAASADAAAKSQQSAAIDAKTASDAKVAAAGSAEAAAGSANAAENSASAAAGSEQAAGTSELKAAKSEEAAKASEQAASESAQAALESKTAAATSEVNAAASAKKAQDVADSLPEDYTTAVNDIATLKQQVANITPDDSTIGGKPWSSKHIIDMLCPPLEESGNPVVCYPVAGYPLGIKAKWEPAQEGSGTPYPAGCGKQLLDTNKCVPTVEKPYGMTITLDGDVFKVSGVPNEEVTTTKPYSFAVCTCSQEELRGKGYKVTAWAIKGKVDSAWGLRTESEDALAVAVELTPGVNNDIQFRMMVSKDTPTAWEPYENIRPIKGRDSVKVERCGANLSKISDISTPNKSLIPVELPTEIVADIEISFDTLNAEIKNVGTAFLLNKADGKWKAITVQNFGISTAGKIPNGRKTAVFHGVAFKTVETGIMENGYCKWSGNVNNFCVSIIQNAPYTPYTGQTNTLTMSETVYGGEVDAVSGENSRTWRTITLTGEESGHIYSKFFYLDLRKDSSFVAEEPVDLTTGKSSHYPYRTYSIDHIGIAKDGNSVVYGAENKYPISDEGMQEWKAYLAAQYAAGTPVQVCYKLAKPVPFTATGAQPIPALAGVNTVLTDADSATVTGRADPIKRITDLEDAVASQT